MRNHKFNIGDIVRHDRTGGEYVITGFCLDVDSREIKYTYRSLATGDMFCRSPSKIDEDERYSLVPGGINDVLRN